MLKNVIDKVFLDYSEERKNEICEFLKKQEIDDDKYNTFTFSLFFISKLYKQVPNLKLNFDENIIISPRQTQIMFSHEPVQKIKIDSADIIEKMITEALASMVSDIKKETSDKNNYLITNGNFLTISILENYSYHPKVCIFANCKILQLKDLRKLKLDKISRDIF